MQRERAYVRSEERTERSSLSIPCMVHLLRCGRGAYSTEIDLRGNGRQEGPARGFSRRFQALAWRPRMAPSHGVLARRTLPSKVPEHGDRIDELTVGAVRVVVRYSCVRRDMYELSAPAPLPPSLRVKM